MNVYPLTLERVDEFIGYCKKYRKECDESYLPDDFFKPNPENPTYLLYGDKGELLGAASLMLEPRFRNNKQGRFRILHSVQPYYANYKLLVNEILKHTEGIENIYLFIPEKMLKVRNILEQLNFNIQRFSWYLEKKSSKVEDVNYSNEFEVKPMEWDKQENIWCSIINSNFANYQGFSKLEINDVRKLKDQKDYVDEGMLILWREEEPIGTVQINIDIENGVRIAYISWLSINKNYRGIGFGRKLLKSAIKVANNNKAKKIGLVVHSKNEGAIKLYTSEGFRKGESMVCYNRFLITDTDLEIFE